MNRGLDEIYSGIKNAESKLERDVPNIMGVSTDYSGRSEIPGSTDIGSYGLEEESRADSELPGGLGLGGITGIGDVLGIGSTGLAGNSGIFSNLGGISGIVSALEGSASGSSNDLATIIEKGIEAISDKLSGTSYLNRESSGKNF